MGINALRHYYQYTIYWIDKPDQIPTVSAEDKEFSDSIDICWLVEVADHSLLWVKETLLWRYGHFGRLKPAFFLIINEKESVIYIYWKAFNVVKFTRLVTTFILINIFVRNNVK
jgi:hypothetical protein